MIPWAVTERGVPAQEAGTGIEMEMWIRRAGFLIQIRLPYGPAITMLTAGILVSSQWEQYVCPMKAIVGCHGEGLVDTERKPERLGQREERIVFCG